METSSVLGDGWTVVREGEKRVKLVHPVAVVTIAGKLLDFELGLRRAWMAESGTYEAGNGWTIDASAAGIAFCREEGFGVNLSLEVARRLILTLWDWGYKS